MRIVMKVPEPSAGESRFDVIVRRWVGEMHAFDMNDPAIRLEFEELTGEIKAATLAVGHS